MSANKIQNRRCSPALEAQMRRVLRDDETELLAQVVDLDNWPRGVTISFKAAGRKGTLGLWPRGAYAYPNVVATLLGRIALERDPDGWAAACSEDDAWLESRESEQEISDE